MTQCQIFSPAEKESVRKGGKILRACLEHTASKVEPGITTGMLDEIAEQFIRSQGGIPAFKGYNGFAGTLCTSVNEQCVHGLPGSRELTEGDIISIDCGVIYDDLYTDACVTVPVGAISDDAAKLLDVTQEALERALDAVRAGAQVGDISATVQNFVESQGCKAVKSLTGHGLGRTLHQFPDIPNVGTAGTGPELPADTVIAIEPIVSLGADTVTEADDGWTLSTKDGALSAHFEHTILVTDGGYEIMA